MNSSISNSTNMNVVNMEKSPVHKHPLFEITWVVAIYYFWIYCMPHLRLNSSSVHIILMKLLNQGEQWSIIFLNLTRNEGFSDAVSRPIEP